MTTIPDGRQQPGTPPAAPPPSRAPFRLVPSPPAGPTSVGDAVYDQILEALQDGRLQPGERLHDGEFAAQLGVSRTPVREALLRLRELGVVEFAPARYTRVAIINQAQTGHAVAAWVTVYAAIAAVAASSSVPAHTLKAMADAHARFQAASEPFDIQALSAANAAFYDQPTKHCDNPMLVRCAERVVHVVRLGLLQLPGTLDPAPLHAAQEALLAALTAADPRAARQAVYRIAEIPLPRNTPQREG
jgi:DNA-binding GntR family transcriptional regulator